MNKYYKPLLKTNRYAPRKRAANYKFKGPLHFRGTALTFRMTVTANKRLEDSCYVTANDH